MGSVVCKAEQKTDFMFYIKLPFFLSSSTLASGEVRFKKVWKA